MATVDRTGYYNDMLARLEEVLYQELSRCASWKMDFVGADYLTSKDIKGDTAQQIDRIQTRRFCVGHRTSGLRKEQ